MIPARRAINFPFVSKHLSHSPNPNLNPYTLALRATPPSVLEFFDEDDETSVEGSKTTSSSSSIISEVVDESDEISEVKTRKAGKARKKKKSTVDEDMFNEFRLRWNQQEREQNSDVVEEKPPPLNDSINTDRFIAVSMDPQSDPRASFLTRISANEGHVKHCQISARMSLEEKQTTNPTPTVVFSHSILSPNLQTEIGQVLCIDATSLTALKSFVSSDPIVSAFGNHDVKIYRWSKETHHLLRADDGKGGYPHMVLSMYKEDKKSQGQANFPSHLDFLKDKRKAITQRYQKFVTA
ncbi:hypothetical protein ScalyP_jg4759 [Parmales sp. scaly parma]|nr:hypothetical protein ScalyP_jg4759 [Parmales sp. scaly parma]